MGPTTPVSTERIEPEPARRPSLGSWRSSGVKSCTFDLSNINGMSIKVNRDLLNEAHVTIMGNEVPLDDTNGWRMNTDTQLELTGSAQTPGAPPPPR